MDFSYRFRIFLSLIFIGVAAGVVGFATAQLGAFQAVALWVGWLFVTLAIAYVLVLNRRIPALFPDDGNDFLLAFQQEAADGDAVANYVLGRCHEQGIGTSIELPTARKYYNTAAEQHLPQAEQALARLNEGGPVAEPARNADRPHEHRQASARIMPAGDN